MGASARVIARALAISLLIVIPLRAGPGRVPLPLALAACDLFLRHIAGEDASKLGIDLVSAVKQVAHTIGV
jgi:hypothetical protein